MIGDGLGRSHLRRLGCLNFDGVVPQERLDLLSPSRNSVNPSALILYAWQDNCTHSRVSASDAVTGVSLLMATSRRGRGSSKLSRDRIIYTL